MPCAGYIAALHHLVAGKYSTATQVIAVVVFVAIEFLLILVPFAFLELLPEVPPELQRIRGPYPIAAGVEAYVKRVNGTPADRRPVPWPGCADQHMPAQMATPEREVSPPGRMGRTALDTRAINGKSCAERTRSNGTICGQALHGWTMILGQ